MTVLWASASELATVSNTFRVGTTPTDPTTVTLVVTDPTGTATTYTYAGGGLTRTSAGVYTKDVPCPTAGTWQGVWTGTGTVQDVEEATWEVQETELGKLYVTPAALRSRLGLGSADTSADLELHAACFTATRWLEQFCDRHFWRTPSTEVRVFRPWDAYRVRPGRFNDIVSLTSLATDNDGDGVFETTWAPTDYELRPRNPQAAPEQRPYREIHAVGTKTFPLATAGPADRQERAQGTGVFGWPAVPQAIHSAAAIHAAELFKLKDAPFGVASFGEMGMISVRVNPMVERLAAPYRLTAVLIG